MQWHHANHLFFEIIMTLLHTITAYVEIRKIGVALFVEPILRDVRNALHVNPTCEVRITEKSHLSRVADVNHDDEK